MTNRSPDSGSTDGRRTTLTTNGLKSETDGAMAAAALSEKFDGKSDPMDGCNADMRRVLTKLEALGAKPLGTRSVQETRKQPTPADAVRAVLEEDGRDAADLIAGTRVTTLDVSYPTGGGMQPARIYTPGAVDTPSKGGRPVIVYYHGGGWVIASIDTYDSSAMALAEKAGALVVSVEYRHAPEHKFPAQHDDAFNAYKWVLENAKTWGGNPNCVAVAGESAGGNLALNVAIKARNSGVQMPVHVLMVYPVAGVDMTTPSYIEHAHASPLSKQGMEWFVSNTISKEDDKKSPMLDLVGKADLHDLPGATILTAEIDPLQSEGALLASKLRSCGSIVRVENFDGVCHEFFGMDAVIPVAGHAQNLAARELRAAFEAHN
jgi:acetyl esterase/lipase